MEQQFSLRVLSMALMFGTWIPLIQAAESPKIGLALSGGGARGFAHIGVLEWFEDHQVPVHYVAGTSMGGLVGGLYAAGQSPQQMRQLLEEIDWGRLLSTSPPFENLTFRRKEERRLFPNQIDLGFKKGLSAPDGLIAGHTLRLMFDRIALPYSSLEDFDQLPVPFRCVAADLISGRRVVLESGPLGDALSATMAIPGVFRPVEIDDQWLVDGGVLNNLPADIVREMGADIVISVDISSPLKDRESLTSLFSVLDQTMSVMMLENLEKNRRASDILLSPDLDGFSSMDFESGQQIADAGRSAAEAKSVILGALSVGDPAWKAYLADRESRKRTSLPTPDALKVEGTSTEAARRIEGNLKKHAGQKIDPAALERDLDRIHGWGRYARLGYRLQRSGDSQLLLVGAEERSNGPPFLQVGFNASNLEADNVQFNLTNRVTFLDVGGYGSEWLVETSLGSRLRAATEYYHPVGAGFFAAPRVFADRESTGLYAVSHRVAEYRTSRRGLGIDAGYGFGKRQNEIRFGYELVGASARVNVGDPLLPSLDGTASRVSLRWAHNSQDNAIVPRRGLRLDFDTSWFFEAPGSRVGFPQSELRLSRAFRMGKNSLVFRGGGGTTYGKQAPPLQQFTLGGFQRLGGFGYDEFRGSRYLFVSPGYLREIGRLPALAGDRVYAGAWHEVGSVFERAGPRDYNHSFTLGALAETLIGPVFAGGSWGEGGHFRFYVSVGSVF